MVSVNVARAAVAGIALFVGGSMANAATVLDTYIGGNATNSSWVGQDVIGDSRFEIQSLEYTRTGDSLTVKINTNYSDVNASTTNVGALGTSLGSLFIGDLSKFTPNGPADAGLTGDTYNADKDRFGWVFDFNGAVGTSPGQGGTASLFAINDAQVVQSNASGIFRAGQAVGYNQGSQASLTGGTWQVGVGSVTFTIADFFDFVNPSAGLLLGWAMTCANDVILAQVPASAIPQVPVPPALFLLGSGLLGIGFLGRFRRKAA